MWVLELFLLGFEWTVALMLAPMIHELGHILALRYYEVPIYAIRLRAFGASIETAPIQGISAAICAAAGPAAGCLLVLLYPVFPKIALCALVQTVFNLLPLPKMDGWRIIHVLRE